MTGNGKLRASALGRDPGTCSAGPYAGQPEVCGGADTVVPVDLYVPGCQPHPVTLLDGLLRLLGRR